MLAFVFPGQGSQKRGMGQGLFDSIPEYAAVEQQVDALLGYSLRQLCLEDPGNQLKDTQYTQPALYTINALHFYQAVSQGLTPTYLAGHSLGEYNALLAAGVFDFLTGLQLVQKRGELMAQAKNGGMAAVIGLGPKQITAALQGAGLASIDVANFNSPSQTVVSGPVEDIQKVGPVLQQAGARMCVPLQVGAAFHSRYVADAGAQFAAFLAQFTFAAPKVPVVANFTAQPYSIDNASEGIKSTLVAQISNPVQWTQSVRYLLAQGVKEFKELGPGNVLTKLVQQIQKEQDG